MSFGAFHITVDIRQPVPVKPYGCHNQPRPVAGAVTHYGQNGWERFGPFGEHYRPKFVPIRHVMTTHCVTGTKPEVLKDPRCAGCQHINQGAV